MGIEADFRQIILTVRKSQWPDLPQSVSQGLPGGLKHCMRFPAKQLISQLPTTLFFFCRWRNRKPNHLALGYKLYLTLPRDSCHGHNLLINHKLPSTASLTSTSFSRLPVTAGPHSLANHELRYQLLTALCQCDSLQPVAHHLWWNSKGHSGPPSPCSLQADSEKADILTFRKTQMINNSKSLPKESINNDSNNPLTANQRCWDMSPQPRLRHTHAHHPTISVDGHEGDWVSLPLCALYHFI